MKKHERFKLQSKLDAVVEILKSVDFSFKEKHERVGSNDYVYFEGQKDGTIDNKLIVARRMLLELSKKLEENKYERY